MIRKTNEYFLTEVYTLVGDEYKILSEYVNSRTKIKIKHNKCNHEYEVKPNDFFKKMVQDVLNVLENQE